MINQVLVRCKDRLVFDPQKLEYCLLHIFELKLLCDYFPGVHALFQNDLEQFLLVLGAELARLGDLLQALRLHFQILLYFVPVVFCQAFLLKPHRFTRLLLSRGSANPIISHSCT